MNIKWKKISDWAIECGQINVTKAKVVNEEKFVVWNQGKLIKIYKTSKEAKDHAISLIKEHIAESNRGIEQTSGQKPVLTSYNKVK